MKKEPGHRDQVHSACLVMFITVRNAVEFHPQGHYQGQTIIAQFLPTLVINALYLRLHKMPRLEF